MLAVEVSAEPLDRLTAELSPERAELVVRRAAVARELLAGRVVWNVSSTAAGGGVAEMLHGFLRYVRGAGVDVRWRILQGRAGFFTITKRLHNWMHGEAGDGGPLGPAQRAVYEQVTDGAAREFLPLLNPGDVVILHDPQTAGLVPRLAGLGVTVIWRCHIGTDRSNRWVQQGWSFLRPYVGEADASVFSRSSYAPPWLQGITAIIAPSIDPQTPKNQLLDQATVLAILGRTGILDVDAGEARFRAESHHMRRVESRATVVRESGPLAAEVRTVAQISRWDRLKDMTGVMRGWVQGGVAAATGAHLLLVGPDVAGVSDDPEGQAVLAQCSAMWRSLDPLSRASVSLVTVPMSDLQENAAIINAIQRHATVLVQKSLQEGFGLTVSEGMWKRRPVVASAVGGIQDQLRDGKDGILLPDPADLGRFAAAVRDLLTDPQRADRMGEAGHERVRDQFLADRDLVDWVSLLERLAAG